MKMMLKKILLCLQLMLIVGFFCYIIYCISYEKWIQLIKISIYATLSLFLIHFEVIEAVKWNFSKVFKHNKISTFLPSKLIHKTVIELKFPMSAHQSIEQIEGFEWIWQYVEPDEKYHPYEWGRVRAKNSVVKFLGIP